MSELENLAGLLHAKSLDGKVQWTSQGNPGWTPNGDVRLQTRLGDNYVDITKYGDSEPEMIVLSVRNRDGIVLAQSEFDMTKKLFAELNEIIGTVRRESLGVEDALSELRARLEAL